MRPPRAVLYDWDNTLVDGWAAIAGALNATFDAFAMPRWTIAETRARVRRSLRDTFPGMFGVEWERARDIFYAAIGRDHLDHVALLDGALAVLSAGQGRYQAVVSNKQGRLLRAEAAHLGVAAHFARLVGAGDAVADKPDSAPVLMALDGSGLSPGPEIWFVGDTALDMRTARDCGCIAVLVGDADHDGGVAACNPDMHARDLHSLARMLAGEAPLVGQSVGKPGWLPPAS